MTFTASILSKLLKPPLIHIVATSGLNFPAKLRRSVKSVSPELKKVIPLEMFTSNDQKFFFHTYVIAIENEFIPKLNQEHSGYCWTAFECWPKNLHMGLKNTLNNKAIKGKLQTILDLIT